MPISNVVIQWIKDHRRGTAEAQIGTKKRAGIAACLQDREISRPQNDQRTMRLDRTRYMDRLLRAGFQVDFRSIQNAFSPSSPPAFHCGSEPNRLLN